MIRNFAFAVRCAELRGFASKSCPTVERTVENFGLRFRVVELVRHVTTGFFATDCYTVVARFNSLDALEVID